MNRCIKPIQKVRDNFWYSKVGRAITNRGPKWIKVQYCYRNIVKFYICVEHQKLFLILGEPIIYSPTVYKCAIAFLVSN